jgi:photoactive yellow protein
MGTPGLPDFESPDLAHVVECMPLEAVDRLPFGVIRLDKDGIVTFYSKREAELSGRGGIPTVGLKFFSEVAPCMDNPGFRGRIEAARAAGTLDIEFNHLGDFADRSRELCVRAQSASDGGVWLFHQRVE